MLDKIEIIGVNNFIGFHLTKTFLELGIEVIGYKLPIEEDFFQLKNEEIIRNANFQIKNLNEISTIEKIIVDLYGLKNKENIIETTIPKNIEVDTYYLSDEELNIKDNVVYLPKVMGRFDYLLEDERLSKHSSIIEVEALCKYLVNQLDTNDPIDIKSFILTLEEH